MLGWVLELLEVVFVGAEPDVHLGLEALPALAASLPVACVLLVVIVSAQRITSVIAMAAIARKREERVLVLVIANPVTTAVGARQVAFLST